jgi:hypothetical protein
MSAAPDEPPPPTASTAAADMAPDTAAASSPPTSAPPSRPTVQTTSTPPAAPSSPAGFGARWSPGGTETAATESETPVTPLTRRSSFASAGSRLRSASLRLIEADAPAGAWAGSALAAGKAPTLGQIRRGSISERGVWSPVKGPVAEQEAERRIELTRVGTGMSLSRVGTAGGEDGRPKRTGIRRTPTGLSLSGLEVETVAEEEHHEPGKEQARAEVEPRDTGSGAEAAPRAVCLVSLSDHLFSTVLFTP